MAVLMVVCRALEAIIITITILLVVHTVHNVVSHTMTCWIIELHRERVPSLNRTFT